VLQEDTERSGEWPAELELTVDEMAQGGDAVGRWQDRVVFVAGALPGERVRARVDERQANYARATAVEILERSPERVEPVLADGDHMPWQHIAHAAQLRFKREILIGQLAKLAGLGADVVAETRAVSAPWGYRTTGRLHSDGRSVGYYAAETHALRPIEADPLLAPALNDALGALRRALAVETAGPFEVVLRASETYGYTIGTLRGQGDLRMLAVRWRAGAPGLAAVQYGPRPEESIGQPWLLEQLEEITFQLRPLTFFQAHLSAARALLELVREGLALAGGERLLDLYCGAGVFALPLSKVAGEVLGVEAAHEAVEDGMASVALNAIEGVRFVTGTVERVLPGVQAPVDAVVLDPPRRGCHPQALAELIRLAPARIVYVSCHPGTLARDLKILRAGGFEVLRVTPVDLFPQTPHIEAVAVLQR
jgi:23S rRNA (uracil1939-C5)-methyltransferase